MSLQQLIDIVHIWLDNYRLLGQWFTQEFTIGGVSMTIITALSGSLVFLLSTSFALHLIHLVNPLG